MDVRRFIPLVALAVLAGCGAPKPPVRPPAAVRAATICYVPAGQGVAGVCIRHAPAFQIRRLPAGLARIPDISEFTGCVDPRGPAIIRLFEAGLWLKDRDAACDAAYLRAKHVWFGGYAFLRPGSCTAEADETVRIARSVGVNGPIIADAEVWLPSGFVSCFTNRVAVDTGNGAQVTYTSSGTWPGGSINRRLWDAAYGPGRECVAGNCDIVAWQFADETWCEGIHGDCSIDYGITNIWQGPFRASLLKKQGELRWLLAYYGCRHRMRAHIRLGPKCEHWRLEGNRVDAELHE